MTLDNCSSLKDIIIERFGTQVRVATRKDQCVVTLPIRTVDNERVSVIVEERMGYFLVHDGGKADSELFSQGVALAPKRIEAQRELATRFGVEIVDNVIRRSGPLRDPRDIYDAVLAVAQCVAIVSRELMDHQVEIEDEPIVARVGRAIDEWRPRFVERIDKNLRIDGILFQHLLNFVAYSSDPRHRTVAVRILGASRPTSQAERYGFLVLDTKDHPAYGHWARLAVIHHPDDWPPRSIDLVNRLSTYTVTIKKDAEKEIGSVIPQALDFLSTSMIA